MSEPESGTNGNGSGHAEGYGEPSAEHLALASVKAEIRTLSTQILLDRMAFMRQAGITFDGKRDEYEIFGYDRIITGKQYRDEYARGGIAGTLIDALPDATWRGEVELVEDEDPKTDTAFEKAWKALDLQLNVQAKLLRVDKLSGLSTYGALLFGAAGTLDTELPKGKPGGLLYLRPCAGGGSPGGSRESQSMMAVEGYSSASVFEYETDPQNERFGMPKSYTLRDPNLVGTPYPPVHWTRVLHVAEGLLDDDVFGQPGLERVWNLLIDLRKITGGGSEAFFLRANQGLHVNVDKDMTLTDANNTLTKLKEDLEAYQHNIAKIIRTKGADVNTLGSDVANFEGPAKAVLTQIAGAKRIPMRILTGSEMGELASTQDRDNWRDQINGRQTGYAGPFIVRPLVDRLIKYGYLPAPAAGPTAYKVRWPKIETLTANDKVNGAKGWASVNQTAGTVVFTGDEIRDTWADKEPLTAEQKQALADDAAAKMEQQQQAMVASGGPAAADNVDANGDPLPPKQPLPFARRAAQRAEDLELTRVLAAAIEAGNVEVVAKIVGLQHAYATTQVQLPADVAARMAAIPIDAADVYEPEGGRETDTHVTVRYGLLNAEPEAVAAAVERRGSVTLVLGKTGMFAANDYDVVFVDVFSPDLADLNAAISTGVPVKENDHGVYHPHATVAYVKSGEGHKYVGLDALDGTTVTVDSITLCDVDGNRTEVSLTDGTFKALGDVPGHEFHGNQWTSEAGDYTGHAHGTVVAKSKLGHVEVQREHSGLGKFDFQGSTRYLARRKNGETVGTRSTLREAKELLRQPPEHSRQNFVSGYLKPDPAWKYRKNG